jgi:tetratricopeptide (TPR) repeat protein
VITDLGRVVDRNPDDPLTAKALFRMAQLLWNEDEDVAAEGAFLQFLKRYPDHSSAPDALYALGRIQQSSGQGAAAIASYEKLVQNYPSAKTAWESRWRIGWIEYSERRFSEAAAAFGRLAGRRRSRQTAAGVTGRRVSSAWAAPARRTFSIATFSRKRRSATTQRAPRSGSERSTTPIPAASPASACRCPLHRRASTSITCSATWRCA